MSQYNVDYGVVKKPQHDRELTEWEAQEWIKCSLDPWYFWTTYCYVVGPKGKTLFEPRDYQIEMIDVILDNRFVIINAPRQTGKCIGKDTKYTVRSKKTGETHELTAEEFHAMVKSQRDSGDDQQVQPSTAIEEGHGTPTIHHDGD